ncbi:MAG: peptidylprolyl isomerase [Hyphomonadaceae bacterium]|nr:peptidylprolyl isomerase [Hyphomonadaceae bacterium]
MPSALRLVLIALLISLPMAACTPREESPAARVRVDGAVAAVVNGDPVYLADIELEAASQGLIEPGEAFGIGHPAYQTVLDQLIDQRLMAQEALAKGLNREGTAPRRLEAARERVLGNILVESLVAAHVTDEKIRQMYSQQVGLQQIDDEVRISMILVETEEEAEEVRQRVTTGEEFNVVAFEVSLDTATRLEGGALGYVQPNLMGEPFASAIGDTSVGDVSEPFESDTGWHLIKVEDRRTPPPKTLEEMRPEIVTFLTYAEISQILKTLRAEAVIEPGNGVPTLSPDDLPATSRPDDTL